MSKSIDAIGALRERVTIQDQTQVLDAAGAVTTTWSNITSLTVWGRMEPVSDKTLIIAARDEGRFEWLLTIRYRSDVTVQMRVTWRGRIFDITGFQNPDERRRYLRLRLTERKAGASNG